MKAAHNIVARECNLYKLLGSCDFKALVPTYGRLIIALLQSLEFCTSCYKEMASSYPLSFFSKASLHIGQFLKKHIQAASGNNIIII